MFYNQRLINDFNPAQMGAALYVHDLIERLTNDNKPDKRLAALVLATAGHKVTEALMTHHARLERSYFPVQVPGLATVLLTSAKGEDYAELRKRFDKGALPAGTREPITILVAADRLPTGGMRLRDARAKQDADLGRLFGTDETQIERVTIYDPLAR